jgi:hypothetical protein
MLHSEGFLTMENKSREEREIKTLIDIMSDREHITSTTEPGDARTIKLTHIVSCADNLINRILSSKPPHEERDFRAGMVNAVITAAKMVDTRFLLPREEWERFAPVPTRSQEDLSFSSVPPRARL